MKDIKSKRSEEIFVSEEFVKRIKLSLNGRGHYKPYTILKREISKIKPGFYENFATLCASKLSDSEKINLLDAITLSGDNYKQPWFRSLLRVFMESEYKPLKYKTTTLLKYHFEE